MFDIDNTLELTSFNDDYDSKGTKPTPYMADFVKNQCFKDGVDCYFITARYCNTASATTTAKWLKVNLDLTDDQINKYVFYQVQLTIVFVQQEQMIRLLIKILLDKHYQNKEAYTG